LSECVRERKRGAGESEGETGRKAERERAHSEAEKRERKSPRIKDQPLAHWLSLALALSSYLGVNLLADHRPQPWLHTIHNRQERIASVQGREESKKGNEQSHVRQRLPLREALQKELKDRWKKRT